MPVGSQTFVLRLTETKQIESKKISTLICSASKRKSFRDAFITLFLANITVSIFPLVKLIYEKHGTNELNQLKHCCHNENSLHQKTQEFCLSK